VVTSALQIILRVPPYCGPEGGGVVSSDGGGVGVSSSVLPQPLINNPAAMMITKKASRTFLDITRFNLLY
jgi:hypothetical protein